MIHTDIQLLKEPLQKNILAALEEIRADEALQVLGCTGVAVSETMRELATQMAYYSCGRMIPMDVQAMYKAAGLYAIKADDCKKTITWTLDSKHRKGEAVDIVPTRAGIYWWNAPAAVWNRIGEIGEKHGLSWGGRWKNADCPHFEGTI